MQSTEKFDLMPSPDLYEQQEENEHRQLALNAWNALETPIYEAIGEYGLAATLKAIANLIGDGSEYGDPQYRYSLPGRYCLITFGDAMAATANQQELDQLKG